MDKLKTIKNDCDWCVYCVEHYIKTHGEYHLINDRIFCSNNKISASEKEKRINNEIWCEHFQLIPLQPTELESITYALSGIMSELYEIKQILKGKK